VRSTSRSTPPARKHRELPTTLSLRSAAAGLSDTAALRKILAGCEETMARLSLQGIASLQSFNFSECIGRLYNRLNGDYEVLHGLCRFFLEQSGPLHSTGDHTMFPFLIDVAHLYELFVAEWLREHLPTGYSLQIQANVNFSEANRLKFIIDLVICDLETGRTLCVLDTKYKCPDTPANDDISQVVTYAEIKQCSDAILVYPRDLDANLDERLGDIRVRNLTFKIDGDLEAAGQAFLASANLGALREQS
jgi:5-methylcytosine-specific restriction enzyme subunit McrC